jgi:hypothetical protein
MSKHKTTLDAVITAMGDFASKTRDDRLSVEVSRVVQRLRARAPNERTTLSRRERAVARPFLRMLEAQG